MRKKFFNRFIVALSVVACSLCFVATPTATVPVEAASGEESFEPAAEILEWVYAEVDGKRYKRLFNCTTQQWVGDWIYIGEA